MDDRGRPTFTAVKNISLHIDTGEFMVLIGPSGCGKSTTLRMVAGAAVRMLSLTRSEEVDYWRYELKSNRRNSREIELMTWAENAVTLRGRAHYGSVDEFAEYVFQFNRTAEGKLLKSGAIAFSKSEDRALARQVIDTFATKTDRGPVNR